MRGGWKGLRITRAPAVAWAAALVVALPLAGQMPSAPGTLPEVVERGSGETTLLLLPCMSCRWRSFDTFMERNEDRYRMIAVTAPGYGGTPVPDLPMNSAGAVWLPNAVAAVERLIDERELESVVIVGHSWGGVLGAAVAPRLGERLKGMVFIDAWPTSDRSWFSDDPEEQLRQAFSVPASQAHLVHDLDEWQSFNSVSDRIDPERRMAYHGWFMATPQEVVFQYWRENSLVDLNPRLAAAGVPMLDIKALPSSADPAEYRRDREGHWSSNCPTCDVTTVLVHGTAHLIHEVNPDEVDRLIADFLAERPLPEAVACEQEGCG